MRSPALPVDAGRSVGVALDGRSHQRASDRRVFISNEAADDIPKEPADPGKSSKILAATDTESFETLSVQEQHRVRKEFKRLRDLAEFVGPPVHTEVAARYPDRLTPTRDALGDLLAAVDLASRRFRHCDVTSDFYAPLIQEMREDEDVGNTDGFEACNHCDGIGTVGLRRRGQQ